MDLVLKEEIADAKSRIALLALTGLNLRMMDNWRQTQIALWGRSLDYESTMIVLAVVTINAEHLSQGELEPELQTLSNAAPEERLRRCNISSIAATTGLNRETVRRKVTRLDAMGVLHRRDRGSVQLGLGVLQTQEVQSIVQAQLRSLLRPVNSLIRQGLFAVSTAT